MKCYLATKKEEVLRHASPWMDFEILMLAENSHTQKATYSSIPLILNIHIRYR